MIGRLRTARRPDHLRQGANCAERRESSINWDRLVVSPGCCLPKSFICGTRLSSGRPGSQHPARSGSGARHLTPCLLVAEEGPEARSVRGHSHRWPATGQRRGPSHAIPRVLPAGATASKGPGGIVIALPHPRKHQIRRNKAISSPIPSSQYHHLRGFVHAGATMKHRFATPSTSASSLDHRVPQVVSSFCQQGVRAAHAQPCYRPRT